MKPSVKAASLILLLSCSGSFALEIKVRLFPNRNIKNVLIHSVSVPLTMGKKSAWEIRITPKDKELLINIDSSLQRAKKAEISSAGLFFIKVGSAKRSYYGTIFVEPEGNGLKVINEIPLETYLQSVVTAESRDFSSYQAYKAQAVVARTYTLANINRHRVRGYNLCATTHCQLYNGFSNIKEEIKKAVKETEGKILVYRGRPAWTFYHSICGGITEDVGNIWQYEKKPYLKSVTDAGVNGVPYCSGGPGFKWRTKIALKTFEKFLRKKIISSDEIFKYIRITRLSPSGRVMEMKFVTNGKGKSLSGVDFYHMTGRDLGWNAIRSTKFRVYLERKYIVFEGYGYGHGVGLCQHGADGMAKLGYDYRQILNHYYKDLKMVKLK